MTGLHARRVVLRPVAAASMVLASVLMFLAIAQPSRAQDTVAHDAGATRTATTAAGVTATGLHTGGQPGPERYGHNLQRNVAIRMADGTKLRVDIVRPAVLGTSRTAAGKFPVLLTTTPYGKNNYAIDTHLVHRGYIEVIADIRGTGLSEGDFQIFAPAEVSDGVRLVGWVSRLQGSSGAVGLIGGSYLGTNQLLIAGAVGPHSALKAIFPVAAAHDLYRDVVTMGSIPDFSFLSVWLLGLLPSQNLTGPVIEALNDPAMAPVALRSLLRNLLGDVNYNAAMIADMALTGNRTTDSPYWRGRSPRGVLDKIVANGIPAYLVGGAFDIFQRSEPLNFAGLQNAWAGRPVNKPMAAQQQVTGRYQLLLGPWTHIDFAALDVQDLQIAWYDRWLKGRSTGIDRTRTPLHVIDATTGTHSDWPAYPVPATRVSTYYLGAGRTGTAPSRNDGRLTPGRPPMATGRDKLIWSPADGSVCSRSTDQWLGGLPSTVLDQLGAGWQCNTDDRAAQTGPTVLTYTTAAFGKARRIAGPIAARLYLTSSTKESQLVATVDDVGPDGRSRPLTSGALLGSQRAVDKKRSWFLDGRLVLPFHPATASSAKPVKPGLVTRYDVELFPTFATLKAGHRLRIQVSSTDAPHLQPSLPQTLTLLGGRYEVLRNSRYPSAVSVPFAPL